MFSGAGVLNYSMIFDMCSYFILVKKLTQLSLYSTGNIKSYSTAYILNCVHIVAMVRCVLLAGYKL